MDFNTLTDEQIGIIQREATEEQNRRAVLSGIPLQIAELAAQYRDGGGDPADLIEALDPATIDAFNA